MPIWVSALIQAIEAILQIVVAHNPSATTDPKVLKCQAFIAELKEDKKDYSQPIA